MKLMKRNNKKTPFCLPSTTEFKRFEARKLGGPTSKNFRVQLTGSLVCWWNRHAADVFSQAYIDTNGKRFKRGDLVVSFMTHLRALKKQHESINAGSGEGARPKTGARRTRRQGVSTLQTPYDLC